MEYHSARNHYVDRIRTAKRDHWEAWLESADSDSVWTINKFTQAGPTDGGRTWIPPLMPTNGVGELISDNQGKSEILYDTFFPPPGITATPPTNVTYPPPAFLFTPPTDAQIEAVVKRLKDFRAPGPDKTPNEVYKRCIDILLPYLGPLF
ncbi:hypothetical protein SCP_0603150 [Sparassis crispa]|uniref:Uncharacterized protein n=1 Tax=Sparassis crispa TaxID=139825 RepID=A0A401GQ38_9APHY|nr:hypothetical protein SCP_0603150 [Sparassis crispa]GBE84337.1 hypothetical protein SCP_0603150 [Sparassis crispa]